jgi:glycosyltransferase involved in cell wall biosynthesis
MRIGYLMHGIFYGGATKSLLLLLKSIKNDENEKIIYTISSGAAEIERGLLKYAGQLKVVKLKTISINQVYTDSYIKFKINALHSCKGFVDILIEDKIDILHINTTVFPQVPKWIKNNSTIKIITHIREYIDPDNNSALKNYLVNRLSDYSDALIAISDNEVKAFKTNENIYILPNPFDFSKITNIKSNFRKDHNIPGNTILVAMMSHFSRAKGHENFLNALRIILDRNNPLDQFLFVIVGFRDKRTWWKLLIKRMLLIEDYTTHILSYIKNNSLAEKVMVMPYISNVFEILAAVDIVVRPANSADPWGRDIIEAMAFAKPVVATGTSEFFVENGKTGYLVSSQDPVTLADKIEDLLSNRQKRIQFGNNGLAKIQPLCDMKNYGLEINKIYKSLIF